MCFYAAVELLESETQSLFHRHKRQAQVMRGVLFPIIYIFNDLPNLLIYLVAYFLSCLPWFLTPLNVYLNVWGFQPLNKTWSHCFYSALFSLFPYLVFIIYEQGFQSLSTRNYFQVRVAKQLLVFLRLKKYIFTMSLPRNVATQWALVANPLFLFVLVSTGK